MNVYSRAALHLHYSRIGTANAAWFMARKYGDARCIIDTQRGQFHEDQWHPYYDEHMPCCDKIEVNNIAPYGMIEHCRLEEHVKQIVATLTPDECRILIARVREDMDDWVEPYKITVPTAPVPDPTFDNPPVILKE